VSLTTDDIEKLAHLARLGIDNDALASLATDLSTMLELVEQLQAVDTSQVEPMAHPANAELLLRDDLVTETDQRERLLAPAPAMQDGYFLVPRVIE
jgi:aspartyl-tRNA(Asn)/glutamyl-tRNA(Gln) amidotransferase subunit C